MNVPGTLEITQLRKSILRILTGGFMKKIIIIGLLVVIAGAGAFFFTSNSDDLSNTTSQNTESATANDVPATQSTEEQPATNTQDSTNITIAYTNEGFKPSSLSVKVGTTVTVKNESSKPLKFSSDPHPEHTDEKELNMTTLSPNKSDTFTATKAGRYGFHNHLNEDESGTLIVQ